MNVIFVLGPVNGLKFKIAVLPFLGEYKDVYIADRTDKVISFYVLGLV